MHGYKSYSHLWLHFVQFQFPTTTQKYQVENATNKQLETGFKLCPIVSKHDGFFMPMLLSSLEHELLSTHFHIINTICRLTTQ